MVPDSPRANTRRYLPPTRTSRSQDRRLMPNDFGTHQRLNSSDFVHASNTSRAGPLTVRVTTSSCSDVRAAVVKFFIGVNTVSLSASVLRRLRPTRQIELPRV